MSRMTQPPEGVANDKLRSASDLYHAERDRAQAAAIDVSAKIRRLAARQELCDGIYPVLDR